MGYYSRIDLFDLEVRRDKEAEITASIVSARRGRGKVFGVEALQLEDRQLWWDWECGLSDVQKWRPDEPLVALLAGWCSRGWVAFWSCEGDGGQWAYEFDGEGGCSECSARRVSALRAAETRRFQRQKARRKNA